MAKAPKSASASSADLDVIPPVVPPLPRAYSYKRDITLGTPFRWLGAGFRDLVRRPLPSLAYGLAVFIISVAVTAGLFALDRDYILFPAMAGFLVVGPILALGLYEKSRRLAAGESVTLSDMIFVRPASGGQILFIGVILSLLSLIWNRAAVIIYALFFGLTPFPGLGHIVEMLFTTDTGLAMLAVGTAVGGLFAAFSFAISVFSIPMLLQEELDAFTAMGTSMRIVWNNLLPMLVWGAIVAVFSGIGLVTGFVGLIIVFPMLGHATWHAYRSVSKAPSGGV